VNGSGELTIDRLEASASFLPKAANATRRGLVPLPSGGRSVAAPLAS
jgi:hypothetical protein